MQVTEEALLQAEAGIKRVIRKYPELKSNSYIDPIGYLTFFMLVNDFNPENGVKPNAKFYVRGVTELSRTPMFQELYSDYKAALSGTKYFPVPKVTGDDADITYVDTWYVPRSYGGNRKHEGTDLMASNNIRGYFPVISMTDGSIEKLGWLEQGGYRIGIRTEAGGYFYYAHLDSYAPGLQAGTPVIAGQLIGFMGDSGYGSEGTVGKFDVHLHLGIYVPTEDGDMSINSYYIIKLLEKNRTQYTIE
jgi:murein DD-endopeptidase MepM/ murein hydrolase activator NlpD